jgi:hypothetical protein
MPCSTPLRFPEWQVQYEAAILETDNGKLSNVVAVAELAILNRMHALVGKAGHEKERIAMTDALHALRYLKGSIAV